MSPVRAVCVDHLTLPVSDLERSLVFYDAVFAALGWTKIDVDGLPAWGPPDAEDFSIAPGAPAASMHLAFAADDEAAVQRFHAAGMAHGGRDNGGPGPRPRYSPGYYGAFLLDPDGHNVEAVFHA